MSRIDKQRSWEFDSMSAEMPEGYLDAQPQLLN
jgi:hypothetical protein